MQIFHSMRRGIFIAATGTAIGLISASAAVAQQCPDWQLGGVPITTDAEQAWVPQSYPMYAGGAVDLLQCPSIDGVGHITAAPNFSLSYDDRGMGRDLEIRVQGTCDTTLLINGANGAWSFNDDTNEMNPALRLAGAPSGRYDIWVGTYGDVACSATVTAETFNGAGAQTGSACPDWSLGGAQWNVTTGQRDQRPVQAGGPLNMFEDTCDNPAHGYLTAAPNFSLYFDDQGQASTLDINVTGSCDQTLLINNPSAEWVFNDDAVDLQPGVSIPNAPSGRYDIWVGAFGQAGCESTITVNAYGPQGQGTAPSK